MIKKIIDRSLLHLQIKTYAGNKRYEMLSGIKKALFTILICMTAVLAEAQSFRSAYFLEGVSTRHRMNPAFIGERNYISIPGLGNINAGIQSNVGLTDFIYKYDDPAGKYDLTTFMSSTVGREEFLNKLYNHNRFLLNSEVTVFGTGFYNLGGYTTMELVMRSGMQTSLPYVLFDFMKTGMDQPEETRYQIHNIRSTAQTYAEFALGHAHRLNEKLTVGAKLKFLLAGAYADARINQLDLTMSEDRWEVMARGTLLASMKGGAYKTEADSKGRQIKGFDVDHPGANGWGLAADWGLNWQLTPDLSLSGALTDLGFISWNRMMKGSTLNDVYYFDGFDHIEVDDDHPDGSGDLEDQLDDLGDDLGDLAKFYDQGNTGKRYKMIAANLNLGAEYRMPFDKALSAGFLWSSSFREIQNWHEGRIYAGWSPSHWLDLSVNYGISSLASSLGWILNFHPKGINFFIGSDQMLLKVNSQGIPLNKLNAGIFTGLNVTFGNKENTR